MNEDTENKLGKFLQVLQIPSVIEEMQQCVFESMGGSINLCSLAADKRNLNLFVKGDKKLNLSEQVALSHVIMQKLGYDNTAEGADIIVNFSSLFDEGKERKIYQDTVVLTKQSFEKGDIQRFISTHYPTYIVSHLSRSSGDKDSSEENLDRNAERLAAFIKADPELRESIKTEENWRQTQKKLEEILKEEFLGSHKNTLTQKK